MGEGAADTAGLALKGSARYWVPISTGLAVTPSTRSVATDSIALGFKDAAFSSRAEDICLLSHVCISIWL